MKRRLSPATWKMIRILFGLTAIGFMAASFVGTYRRTDGLPLPSVTSLLLAAVLVVVALLCAARGWTALLPRGDAAELTQGFFTAQLAKYVPGGIWQPVSQVASARRAGLGLAESSAAFPVHIVVQLVAASIVGASLSFLSWRLPLGPRMWSLLGCLTLLALHRRWMLAATHLIQRMFKRLPAGDMIPAQSAILKSFAWTVGTFVASGAALAVIAASNGAARPPVGSIPAFAISWGVGFLAIPVPAGLGVREALLAVLLDPGGPASLVIVASVAHRLLTIAGEGVMFGVSLLIRGAPQDASAAGSKRSL